jgi:hypothetical protein
MVYLLDSDKNILSQIAQYLLPEKYNLEELINLLKTH